MHSPPTLSRRVVTDSSSGSTKLLSTERSLSKPRRRMGPSQPGDSHTAIHGPAAPSNQTENMRARVKPLTLAQVTL